MLHPDIVVRPSQTHGSGLFATRPIRRGCVVWHPCRRCEVWDAASLSALPESEFRRLDEYGYWLANGAILLPCSNAYLMNHSCEAAALDFGLDFGVSVRDIEEGEEITCDYRTFVHDPPWTVQCNCGSRLCEGTISPAQGLDERVQQGWAARLTGALQLARYIEQPLGEALLECSPVYRRLIENGVEAALQERGGIGNPGFLKSGSRTMVF